MSDEKLKKYMDEAFKFAFNFYKKETELINEIQSLKKQLSQKNQDIIKLEKQSEELIHIIEQINR